jgi:hypothetical protein
MAAFPVVGSRRCAALALFACAGAVFALVSVAAAAEHGNGVSAVIPYEGGASDALQSAAAGNTIPLVRYTIAATKDGRTYSGTIVGGSPTGLNQTTTTIDVLVVPLRIDIGGTKFDPTAGDSCISPAMSPLNALLGSPLLKKVKFDGGSGPGHAAKVNGTEGGVTIYNDAFRRAEFWTLIDQLHYHTLFKVTLAKPVTIGAAAVAAMGGGNVLTTDCASLGVLPTNGFETYVESKLLPRVAGVKPTTFVLFLTKDVVSTGSAALNCLSFCTIGYHSATGSPVQTYGVASYDTTANFWNQPGIMDISVLTHEIAEWLDDPLGTNPTPAWGNIGQVGGCQTNWEVGDPLTGTDFPAIKMANGITYHPQEPAFFSWFYNANATASVGAGGKFSMNGSFSGPSKSCPPGGTF